MAKENSFDVVSEVDFQEVENAMNQARKEIATRYDFKDAKVEINRDKEKLTIVADDEFRLKAAIDILESKFVKRGVPIKNLESAKLESALGGMVRQDITVKSGLDTETAKAIVKKIKTLKAKVQPSIQGDQVRVTAKSRDDLQDVIAALKEDDFGFELQYTNYR